MPGSANAVIYPCIQVTRGIHTDCLLNYETVKYFNGEQHELGRYRDAINQYQLLEYRVMGALNLLNLVQNFIIVRIFLTSLLSDIY